MGAAAVEGVAEIALDSRTIASSQDRDLERIFATHLDSVFRFLYRRVGNREDAEDLTSQVFLKASSRLDTGRTEDSVASWIFTVARTVLADHWRRFYRAPAAVELNDEIVVHRAQVEVTSVPSEKSEQVVEAILQALPPRYRRVLELRFLEGYSVEEAAAEMSVTPGNLKVLQHRALARATEIGFPSIEPVSRGDASPFDTGRRVTTPE
jgi:RNA polymerase sigma-70 factor, ECF subfamily